MSTFDPAEVVRILQQHVFRSYEGQAGAAAWRDLPEIPSSDEVCNNEVVYGDDGEFDEWFQMPVNITHGPWNSIDEYVGSHYQMLREDAIAPLRDTINAYKSDPNMPEGHGAAIYTKVHIVGMTCSTKGPAFRVEFSCRRAGKPIRWRYSRRLQQGTIVALSPAFDNFKTVCKVAVVAARPLPGVEQNPPQVDLFWGDVHEADFDPSAEYVMIEARTGYFEASRHMLVAMQKLMTERTPLMEHLVGLKTSIDAPDFITRNPTKNLSSLMPVIKRRNAHANRTAAADDGAEALKEVNVLGRWPEIRGAPLDQSQLKALRQIYGKKVAIIQGPPGTGKTFVSVAALRVMFDNWSPGDPPVIVAAQTNHALDQLLTLVAGQEPNFCRLGGRAALDNLVVRERTMYEVRSHANHGSPDAKASVRKCRKALDASAQALQMGIMKALSQGIDEPALLLEYSILTEEQYKSVTGDEWTWAPSPNLYEGHGIIAYWVGPEQMMSPPRCPQADIGDEVENNPDFEGLDEEELEAPVDDQDMLNGAWCPYEERFVGQHWGRRFKRIGPAYLARVSDLWDIPSVARGEVYHYMRQQLKMKMLKAFSSQMMDYKRCVQELKIAQWQADASIIRKCKIKLIGCTTTGLSKYRGLLASLQPRVLLIEEAAETLEGTILAAMFESLQQLILVGDHQQLRAKTQGDRLRKPPYNLHISMFERLVTNGLGYTMLNEQRRIIPAIRRLLDPFYPNLHDHPSVLNLIKNRPSIPGMGGCDAFTFHHQWPESREASSSKYNAEEASMIAGFFAYLVSRGVEPSKITILTFYTGQRKMIFRRLKAQLGAASTSHFNVFTVDSYQGEENDIILLSLVRSNPEGSIGFLRDKNRVIVALSRARRGLYVFGNFSCLCSADLWCAVTNVMVKNWPGVIGTGLPIVCDKHGTKNEVQNPNQWKQFLGGCGVKCGGKLPCDHICPLNCHPTGHKSICCKVPCRRTLYCGHPCSEECGNPCKCVCYVPGGPSSIADDYEENWTLEGLLEGRPLEIYPPAGGAKPGLSTPSSPKSGTRPRLSTPHVLSPATSAFKSTGAGKGLIPLKLRGTSAGKLVKVETKPSPAGPQAVGPRTAALKTAFLKAAASYEVRRRSRPRSSRPRMTRPPLILSPHLSFGSAGISNVSGPRQWREWNAREADEAETKALEEAQQAKAQQAAAIKLEGNSTPPLSTPSPLEGGNRPRLSIPSPLLSDTSTLTSARASPVYNPQQWREWSDHEADESEKRAVEEARQAEARLAAVTIERKGTTVLTRGVCWDWFEPRPEVPELSQTDGNSQAESDPIWYTPMGSPTLEYISTKSDPLHVRDVVTGGFLVDSDEGDFIRPKPSSSSP